MGNFENINANIAQCFKTQSNIGYDKIYDICHHTQTTVPWGSTTWLANVSLCFLAAFTLAFVALLIFAVMKEII